MSIQTCFITIFHIALVTPKFLRNISFVKPLNMRYHDYFSCKSFATMVTSILDLIMAVNLFMSINRTQRKILIANVALYPDLILSLLCRRKLVVLLNDLSQRLHLSMFEFSSVITSQIFISQQFFASYYLTRYMKFCFKRARTVEHNYHFQNEPN